MYSLQGKGRGRRRRNVTEAKDFSLGDTSGPSVDPAKRSTADKAQPQQQRQQTPASAEIIQKMDTTTDDAMSSFLPIDNNMEHDFPTSGLMQSDMLPGFDGQSIDDYLGSNPYSSMTGQHEFDPGFYFPDQSDSFDSTPIDSLSGESLRTRQFDNPLSFHRYLINFRAVSITASTVRL